jgi:integrase
MEANGRARATIARRLCTIAGFYRYAVEEDLLEHRPAAHVRRPRRPTVKGSTEGRDGVSGAYLPLPRAWRRYRTYGCGSP